MRLLAMRAAAIDRFGPPSVITVHELPIPQPGPREILIALRAAGVGSWDESIRDGSWRPPADRSSRAFSGRTARVLSSRKVRASGGFALAIARTPTTATIRTA